MAIVYQHRRLDTNEIFYIGIGKDEKRAYAKDKRNIHWKRIINKTDYEIEITHRDIIWEEACSIEKYLISFWGRKDLGQGTLVNLTDGGEGIVGQIFSNESRKKMSESTKGDKNPMYNKTIWLGKKHSDISIQKMSDAKKGKKLTEEHKQKMKQAWIIRKLNKII
jgi:hypothetical protein